VLHEQPPRWLSSAKSGWSSMEDGRRQPQPAGGIGAERVRGCH
jgi:hypothetical protein